MEVSFQNTIEILKGLANQSLIFIFNFLNRAYKNCPIFHPKSNTLMYRNVNQDYSSYPVPAIVCNKYRFQKSLSTQSP